MRTSGDSTNEDDDDSVVVLSSGENVGSPDVKPKNEDNNIEDANHDKELEELMAVESTAQACIMHALRIVSFIKHTYTVGPTKTGQ